MWVARNALIANGVAPGTANSGIAGVLVSAGITDHEFQSILKESNEYGALMERAYEEVTNGDV